MVKFPGIRPSSARTWLQFVNGYVFPKWLLVWLIGCTIGSVNAQTTNDNETSDEIRLIAGLRQRRLFELAKSHSQAILNQPLSPTEQVDVKIELLKTQISEAILAGSQERELAWQQTKQSAAQFLERHPNHPRRLLVQVQSGLIHLDHGRLIRQEIEADLVPTSQQQQALDELRQAKKNIQSTRTGNFRPHS